MHCSSSLFGVDQAEFAVLDFAGERVEVVRTEYRAMVFPRHSHDAYTIGVGLRGVGSIWCRGTSHVCRPEDLVIIAPGEVHTGGIRRHSGILSYFAARVPPSLFERCAAAEGVTGGAPGFRAPVLRDARIARALLAVNRLLLPADGRNGTRAGRFSKAHSSGVRAPEALAFAIASLVRHHAGPRSHVAMFDNPAIVRTAKDVIRSHYADSAKTSLESLAAHVGVTPFHLIRAFTRSTSVSPHQYLLQVRVEHARALLGSGKPPALVAALVGFVDQSHLTRHFKRYLGTTPAHYQHCVRD